jgi:ABC-2 type transport system permease protein
MSSILLAKLRLFLRKPWIFLAMTAVCVLMAFIIGTANQTKVKVFLTGLVNNEQQFRAIISIVSVSMAMIGGAYWPLEIVSSKILLTLSKFVPVTYGMELLKGAAVYGNSISDLLYPISILFFMGVVLMGLGINLVERRNA